MAKRGVDLSSLTEKLRNSGLKLTHQRMEVLREVSCCSDHPDAKQIYERVRTRIPAVSLDTVYRTLWTLKEVGLLNTLGPSQERVRFDANTDPHHHFICTRCGRTEDFYDDRFNSLKIPREVRRMGAVEQARVEFRGICTKCKKPDHRMTKTGKR